MNEQDTIQTNLEKLEDLNELKNLIKRQSVFEQSLRLLYKHSTTEDVKKTILKRTGYLAQTYQDWANSPAWEEKPDGSRAPKSLAIAIDGTKTVIAYYETIFEVLDDIAPCHKDTENDHKDQGDDSSQLLNQILSIVAATKQKIDSFAKDKDKNKPADSLSYDDAVKIMNRICGSDAVSERTLREWIKSGKAAKTDLKISFDDLKSVQTWTVWCQSYYSRMTNRLKIKEALTDATQPTIQ